MLSDGIAMSSSRRRQIRSTVVLVVLAALVLPATAGAQTRIATAFLKSTNDSGVSGRITFRDNGSEIRITGNARGLNSGTFYFSLLYDILSVATGNFACEPGLGVGEATLEVPARLTLDEMGLQGGPQLVWNVSANGNGRVSGTVDVDLDRIRTISVRDTTINGGVGPEAVVACGWILPN